MLPWMLLVFIVGLHRLMAWHRILELGGIHVHLHANLGGIRAHLHANLGGIHAHLHANLDIIKKELHLPFVSWGLTVGSSRGFLPIANGTFC